MASERPHLCRLTHGEAAARHEEDLWDASFRENVCCARDIEEAIRQRYVPENEALLSPDCLAPVLEKYGIRRVSFVLAHSVAEADQNSAIRHLVSEEVRSWAERQRVPADSAFGRYYEVNAAIVHLNQLAHQAKEAFEKLGLFSVEQCSCGMYDRNVQGKVLVMSPETLLEEFWSPENQLWLATGGFGCDPKASGRAVYARCLWDDEEVRWNREDFCGVLDEQYLPEWAREKLSEIQRQNEEQFTEPVPGSMAMG